MKKVRIYESEIKRAVRRKLMENILDEEEQITVYDDPSKLANDVATGKVERKETVGVKNPQTGDVNTITVNETDDMSEEFEMKDTYSRKNYRQSPREKDIEGVFGQYSEEIPPSVLRYMRKNPEKIVKRLYDIYGQQMFDYISPNLKDNPQYEVSIEDIVRENLRK